MSAARTGSPQGETSGAAAAIQADALAARLVDIEPIGRGSDGTTRLAWTAEDTAAGDWFAAQAADVGLRVERDPAGNRWAVPATPGPWWAVGSHLDSVRGGGSFDGALGVAAAFEIARASTRPIAVIAFADEEGARFNTPTFGSRALAGELAVDDVLAREDETGTTLFDALVAAGVDPDGLRDAPAWIERLRGFLEVHIDQSRDVALAGAPAGVVVALASRLRLQIEFHGHADHAGTTPPSERRDALATAARLIVAVEDRATNRDIVATAARLIVEPNALTTIPRHVRLWLDARAPSPAAIDAFHEQVGAIARELAAASGVGIELTLASRSEGVRFHAGVNAALERAGGRLGWVVPKVVCFAGHDAGYIALHRPAAMVLVRNTSGVSHAPDEHVWLDDAAIAASLALAAIEELAA